MRDDETARAYRAFEIYRDMGPGRSLERLAQNLGKTKAAMEQWSVKHGWGERVRAFDAEAARRASAKSLNDHAEVRARQAQLGRMLQAKGAERIAKLNPLEFAPAEAVKTIVDGAKLEREAVGIVPGVSLTGADGEPLIIAILKASVDGL